VSPALVELVRLLAEVAVEAYIAELADAEENKKKETKACTSSGR